MEYHQYMPAGEHVQDPQPYPYSLPPMGNPAYPPPSTVPYDPNSTVPYDPNSPKPRYNVNQKERRRNMAINQAFFDLQRLIPYVPDDHRLPKIKTLRLAVNYIGFLRQILDNGEPDTSSACPNASSSSSTSSPSTPSPHKRKSDFAQIVAGEIQARNSYKDRADVMIQEAKRPKSESTEFYSSTSSHLPLGGSHTWPQCSCCPF